MERDIFGEHPVDDTGEFACRCHDGFAFSFLFGNPVVEVGKKAVGAASDMDPGALDKEIPDGGGTLFGDVAMVVCGG